MSHLSLEATSAARLYRTASTLNRKHFHRAAISSIFVCAVKLESFFHQFHPVAFDALWNSVLRQPEISRMEAKAVSLDSPKRLDRMRAEIRTRHYSIRAE
jgi:hypothetical protein